MIRRVAQGNVLPDEIVADVLTKTDGVPLFIEELTKTLLESGLLEQRDDRYQLAGPLPPLAIPDTLHDSLMARLDRLSATKALAQLGAVIGREFSYPLLKAVSPWNEDLLQQGLAQLVGAELLYQQGALPHATYRFKHALIRDAAYQSLLKRTRQQHHQRIAAAIESAAPEAVETQPELLAHHYTEAGLTERAVTYWYAAATHALGRHASQEAINHATRGLELLASQPDTRERGVLELKLQQVLGPSLSVLAGPLAPERVHARAYALAREVGDFAAQFPALSGLIYAKILHGQMPQARALAREYLELADSEHDPLIFAAGHWMAAYTAWWQGDVVSARYHSRKGLEFYDPDQRLTGIAVYNQNPGIVCGYVGALAEWVLGHPAEAAKAMARVVRHAIALEHPYSVAITRLFSAQLAQLRREPEAARIQAEEAYNKGVEIGAPALSLWCLLPRGWALAQQGDVTAGIADIKEAMDRRRAFGMRAVWPWYLTLLAEAFGLAGEVHKGFDAVDEALEWVRRNDERLYESEAHRIRGELLLRSEVSDPAQAEECFEQALHVARAQQAKSWELRASTSMARLWFRQGRRHDARDLLTSIYGWFTEGFDTADLQDAKDLLGQLS